MMRFVKLLICSLLFAAGANAQDISNKGKEFWVGYGHHQFMENLSNTQEMVIYLSAERPATVKVSIDSSLGNWSQTVNIPANTVVSVGPMPKSGPNDCRLYDVPITFGGIGGEGVFRRKGIHIEADTPIVAYAHIYGSASSGASMLTPIESWGHNYITINSDQVYANNCFSWFYVIASKDSTYVEITPSVPSVLGRPANIPFTVMLMKGQIYQYTAAIISGSNGYNATGSKIRSVANASGNCFPVAVFAGSSRTTNPAACGSGGGDNDNQQCFPTQAWGKRYLTAPTSSSTGAATFQTNNYRVLVKDPTTIVKRNGVQIPLASIINNSYYKFESNAGELIEADKPIMVAQHMTGGGCSNGGLGDPEMIYISSMEQAINRIGFYRNTRENITVNYLTMIVPAGAANSVRIDGSATVDHSYVHPRDPNYRVLVKRWSAAQAQAIVTCDSGFTAITYGLGSVESYGYNAGTFLKNLNVVGSIRNPADSNSAVAEHQFTCKLTPVKISAFIRYKPTKLVWRISQVGPQISPNTDVTDNAPVPIDSSLIFGVKYYKYTLPGNYTFSDTGTFTVPLLSSHPTIENCYLTENISFPIVVKARPNPNFTFAPTTAICELDTIQFTGQPATLNGYTVQQYRWTFPGPALDSGQIVKRLLPAGVNNVNLRVVTTDGCVADTTKQVTTYAKPVADFSIAPASICQNGLTTFTDNSSYGVPGAFTSWYWDFGNGTTVTLPNGNPQTASYPSYGNIAVKHVVKVSNTCISDTVTKILPVWAKPIANFTFPTGCLPTNGQITFTNTTTVPDLQAWTCVFDLGDGNTSNSPNPTHVYTSEGTYTVRLIVTTANGCSDTISKSVQIKITPALSFPVLNAVCESSAPVSVALATVTNGIAGTGVYSGPGTNAAGMFNPAAAGFGVHTIKYVFTTTGGCIDSITRNIQVLAKPAPDFSFPTGCLPTNGLMNFTNLTTLADAQNLSYTWTFGDATPPNNAINPAHTYAAEGNYQVILNAFTNNGCTASDTSMVTVKIRPALSFPVLNAVCESAAPISVAVASVTNGVTGSGVYSGPGTNTAGMFDPAAAGSGIHTIKYVFTTTGGCADSITRNIQVFAKPNVNFSFPNGCLPANGQITFTNLSTIADGQGMLYSWNFGDGSGTSTAQNPTYNYTAENTYPVTLTVNTTNGCTNNRTINVPVSIRPALTYPALTPVCASVTTPFSVATASVTNGITGTGVYSGPGTNAAGQFNPSVAGAGNHTIWYVFTTNGGCKDSVSTNMQVQPKPTSSFTVTPDVCLGQAATITDNSTIGVGAITSWRWDFGDGTTAVNNNGAAFTKTYTTAGPYTVKLVTISSNGCVSDTVSRVINIRPIPVASFNMPASVCFPNRPVQFTNTSTIADNSALTYSWDFGDLSAPSTVTSPAHVYAAIGSYNIRLRATSAYGCFDDSVRVFNSFFDKPVAGFSVTPDTLCQGADNIFTDLSTAPNSTIQNWRWIFDDGSTSTTQNPVKRFINPGNYDVQLVVTNAVGCVSDTFSKTVVVYLQPVIDAGNSFVVPQGTTIQFNATANDPNISFLWSPATGLSNPAILKPTLVANADQTYTLIAMGQGGCIATDNITVKILKPVKIPNAFSPNGDGVNDRWVITNIADYPGATVEVFNRYGQSVYFSEGYNVPWNGTVNGAALPVATYYYIINLKNGFKPLNGSVTIVR